MNKKRWETNGHETKELDKRKTRHCDRKNVEENKNDER